MVNFILIAVCIIGGILTRKYKTLPADAHKGINAWLINIALPAVSLKYLPHIQWSQQLILPLLSPLIVWLGAWVFVRFYAASNNIHKATEGGLKLTSGLCNTSFVGFPLVIAYFGEEYLPIAIICDQVTFLLLSTAGVIVAINSSARHHLSVAIVAKKVISFPPFLGCIFALVIPTITDISFLDPMLDKVSATVGPLALFSIGLQLKFAGWRSELRHLSAALIYKLLIAPALVLSIALLFKLKGEIIQVTLFEAAMPSLVSSGIVAEQYGLNTRLANLVIATGITLAFLTSGLWYLLIKTLL